MIPASQLPRLIAIVPLLGLASCLVSCSSGTEGYGPPVVRRLTESQYRATIADVFGAEVPIVGRFERGLRSEGLLAVGSSESGVSPFALEQYDASALGIASAVLAEEARSRFVPCAPDDATRFDRACADRFVDDYGRRLFRRPLRPEERSAFVETARRGTERLADFHAGLEFALVGMLVSPEFLLRVERAEPDPDRAGAWRLDAWSRATRLAYFLTDSTPDDELLRAAGAGELDDPEGRAGQVDRLIASPGFDRALRAFFDDMLRFDLFEDLSKDPIIYPAFGPVTAEHAREQTIRTVLAHVREEGGDYRELFTTRKTWLTRRLGIVYAMPVRSRRGWEEVTLPEVEGRAGIHTHLSFLALNSHPGRSSATLRGAAIREAFLCQTVPAAPAQVGDFTVFEDTANPDMPTARDRLEVHQTEPTCANCHRIMDPIGLTLERFDGIGAHRTSENGVPIDVSGSLDGRDFEGGDGLGEALRDHPATTECLVRNLYQFAVGRETLLRERPVLARLQDSFAESGYSVPDLARSIALDPAFFGVAKPAAAGDGDGSPEGVEHALAIDSDGGAS